MPRYRRDGPLGLRPSIGASLRRRRPRTASPRALAIRLGLCSPPSGADRVSTAPVFVVTILVFAFVGFIAGLMTAGASPALAQDDLTPRLEAALGAAGVTGVDSVYDPAGGGPDGTGGWTIVSRYRGDRVQIEIAGFSSAQAARDMHSLITMIARDPEGTMFPGSSVSPVAIKEFAVNDVVGHGGSGTTTWEGVAYTGTSVWWDRDGYWVIVRLFEVDDITLAVDVAHVVDDVLSGKSGSGGGSGGGTLETLPPPIEQGLSAAASPATFTSLGDSVTVRVTLTGVEVEGKGVSLMGHGLDLSGTTDAGGGASFTVTHDDETLSEYRFAVTSEGMTTEVTIPVGLLDIRPEREPGSDTPYAGVVADGRTALLIEIALGADGGGTLRVAAPDLGTLRGDALGADGAIALTDGTAALEYVPPPYLDSARLTEQIPLPESGGATIGSARAAETVYANGGRPWAAPVPLTFLYTDPTGRETPVVVDVLVVRPPVLLVHGFGGSRATWAQLQAFLAGQRFDAVINEYYLGDQGVHDQAEGLGTDIAREVARYASLGLKAARADVVGHSMGGLIAREYAYGLPPHPTNVRKIIMVGTPNHGANFIDKCLGNIMAEITAKHPRASQQLYSGSAFLAHLNAGEAVGRHLSPDVQYGNIYGVRSDYVVTGTSAYLNGVSSHIMSGVTHSSDIPLPGVPITGSNTVFGWVAGWLVTDIPRAPLRDTRAQVVDGEASVYISGLDAGGETRVDVTAFPHDVQPWEHVGTGPDSRAKIRLSVAGQAWGTIDLAPDTLIALGNLTPDAVTVRVRRGSARFRSLERAGGGHFEVVIGETDPGTWTTLHPDAKVIGLDTDFVAAARAEGGAEVLVLSGRALFDDGATLAEDDMVVLGEAQAGAVGVVAGYRSQLAAEQWWTDGFYRLSFLGVLREWWAVLRSKF